MSTEVQGKVGEVLGLIEGMTVMELSQLSKAFQEKFGVTAAAPVAVAAAAAPGAAAAAPVVEEQTEFDVILKGVTDPAKKIQVVKEVRAVTNLGLKEAKDLVESAPQKVKEAVSKDEAGKIKEKLVAAGAEIEIK